jgi:isopenicillin N synthase-like dioxygenase
MSATSEVGSVPVIDASRLDDRGTLLEIDRACREWGFFQVVHHGVDARSIASLHREMLGFFSLPREAKRKVERSDENPWGFYDRELTKNTRDWKQIFDCGQENDLGHPTPFPVEPADFGAAVRAFRDSCEGLAFRLLAAISRNLGMPSDHLGKGFLPHHSSFLRLNYYPMCPAPERPRGISTPSEGYLGVNHHTDAGALTLLIQDEQPGLEVYHQGQWHLVEPCADALVINIGDIVQVWSNDRYRAALHRVRASETAARFSAPFFFNPDYETTYAPLPTATDSEAPRYRPIRWGEFRALRAAGDYADRGDEVQIHDYRTREDSDDQNNSSQELPNGIH